VVLLLIGLISGVVSLKLAGAKQTTQPAYWAQRIGMQDHQARQRAKQTGQPVDLVFDIETQHARIEAVDPTKRQANPSPTLTLTNDWRIHRIWPAPPPGNGNEHASSGRRHREPLNTSQHIQPIDRGQVPIRISSQGWSNDYAIELTGPNDLTVLLVTAGLTGVNQRFESATDAQTLVDNLFNQASAPKAGPDAG